MNAFMLYVSHMENGDYGNGSGRFEGAAGVATRVFAVLGFVAVIGIGMWGSVQVASGVPGAFSSLAAAFVSLTSVFVPANEAVTLSLPSSTQMSGAPFTLSFAHAHQSGAGSYTFRYDCANGVYFTSPAPTGSSTTAYCNVPFNFNSSDSLTLTPFSTEIRTVPVTVYIDYTPNGASKPTVSGKAVVTVENGALPAGAATTTPVQKPSTPSSAPVTPSAGPSTTRIYPLGGTVAVQQSDPNGYVQFGVHIIDIGVVDRSTGTFISSSTPSISMATGSGQYRIAVRFAVENNGTKTSPQFSFNAVLPTLPSYIFSSPMQQALAPGDRIEYTLGFDSFDRNSNHVFTVNVDPTGSVNEPNRDLNIVHYTVPTSL